MKPEVKLYCDLKKNIKCISWIRLENRSLLGTPDLLGYSPNEHFFTLELKYTSAYKVRFSPHQKLFHLTRKKRNFILVNQPSLKLVKLYESSSIPGLLVDHRETPSLAINDWDHIQRLLLESSPDA